MKETDIGKISTRADNGVDKQKTKVKTAEIIQKLKDLQNLLYAENKHALLIIIQGMDASGKDGVIKNVFGELNPQGVNVKNYKAPTDEELSHDFLWRVHPHAPAKGMIHIFNRSHYEDKLITRVHKWCDDKTAKIRMNAINDFEEMLVKNTNTHILKFYLHISPEKQKARLEERLNDPAKMWKYHETDFAEAKLWNDYMKMYKDCFTNCNKVPWIIVPSDQNWYKEHIISNKVYNILSALDMKFPRLKKVE